MFKNCTSKAPARHLEDNVVMFRQFISIQQAAMKCNEEELADPGLNCAVSSSMLSTRGKYDENGISFCNVTTARIEDKSLLPRKEASGKVNE